MTGLLEAEDLLKLIDDKKEIRVLADAGKADGLDETEVASAESSQKVFFSVFLLWVVEICFQQGLGEKGEGVAPGMGHRNFPGSAGLDHFPAEELREQPATHEGGFAAARGADHGDEAVGSQAL